MEVGSSTGACTGERLRGHRGTRILIVKVYASTRGLKRLDPTENASPLSGEWVCDALASDDMQPWLELCGFWAVSAKSMAKMTPIMRINVGPTGSPDMTIKMHFEGAASALLTAGGEASFYVFPSFDDSTLARYHDPVYGNVQMRHFYDGESYVRIAELAKLARYAVDVFTASGDTLTIDKKMFRADNLVPDEEPEMLGHIVRTYHRRGSEADLLAGQARTSTVVKKKGGGFSRWLKKRMMGIPKGGRLPGEAGSAAPEGTAPPGGMPPPEESTPGTGDEGGDEDEDGGDAADLEAKFQQARRPNRPPVFSSRRAAADKCAAQLAKEAQESGLIHRPQSEPQAPIPEAPGTEVTHGDGGPTPGGGPTAPSPEEAPAENNDGPHTPRSLLRGHSLMTQPSMDAKCDYSGGA